MALEDSDDQTSQDWTGSCELNDMAVTLTEGRGYVSLEAYFLRRELRRRRRDRDFNRS